MNQKIINKFIPLITVLALIILKTSKSMFIKSILILINLTIKSIDKVAKFPLKDSSRVHKMIKNLMLFKFNIMHKTNTFADFLNLPMPTTARSHKNHNFRHTIGLLVIMKEEKVQYQKI